MPPRSLRLSGVTAHDRHEVVAGLTEVLNEAGWIVDFRQFSNMALAVQFELSPREAPRFRELLATLPVKLSTESLAALAAMESSPVAQLPDPLPGAIHVTFVHSEGDLRIPVPAVPG